MKKDSASVQNKIIRKREKGKLALMWISIDQDIVGSCGNRRDSSLTQDEVNT
jgi:hypothetical protein